MKLTNESIHADLKEHVARTNGLLLAIERAGYQYYPGDDHDEQRSRWEEEVEREIAELHDALRFSIATIATRVVVFADALGLRECRSLMHAWCERWTYDDLARTRDWHTSEGDGVESAPFSELLQVVNPLLVLTRPSDAPLPDPVQRRDRELLEHCLRSLAKLCRDRNVVPAREHDVQAILHSHLEGVFPDYTRKVTIDKPLVSFRADGGIPSLKTAIECKFVASEGEVKTAVHGLTEDLSGYAGSAVWTRFFSVIYMTEAFATEGQICRALGASGNAGEWTTILVTGAGTKREQATKARRKQRQE